MAAHTAGNMISVRCGVTSRESETITPLCPSVPPPYGLLSRGERGLGCAGSMKACERSTLGGAADTHSVSSSRAAASVALRRPRISAPMGPRFRTRHQPAQIDRVSLRYLLVSVEFHVRSDLVASVRPSARRHLCIARPRAATAGSPAPTRVVLGQERLETVLMEPSSTVLNKA